MCQPEKRNKGIEKIIIKKLYNILETNKCYKASLQCKQHNITFYEKNKYKVNGVAMQRFVE